MYSWIRYQCNTVARGFNDSYFNGRRKILFYISTFLIYEVYADMIGNLGFFFCRSYFGTTFPKGGSQFECNSDCMSHCLCWLLPISEAHTTISKFCYMKTPFVLLLAVGHLMSMLGFSYYFLKATCNTCRKQCRMDMPCAFLWLEVQCFCHYFCFSSFYQRIWSMLCLHVTFLCSESSLFRMFFSLA